MSAKSTYFFFSISPSVALNPTDPKFKNYGKPVPSKMTNIENSS